MAKSSLITKEQAKVFAELAKKSAQATGLRMKPKKAK